MSLCPSLILVDGSSYFFRAFHALPPLTTSTGLPTGAAYGVANMIKRLLKDYNSEHVAIIFDAKGKTFREDLYPDYKAHRPPMPTDLSSQFQPLVEILEAMGLPVILIDGVEADDVIGTLAQSASEEGHKVLISTGDKDMAQLVNDNITLINTMSNQVLDETGVKAKFGVEATQIIDYLTLIGDSVDNIPGIPKCGPKTAAKWLQEYQTLDNLIANAHAIKGKIGENLRDSLNHLPLSKQLITLKKDVALPITLSDLKPKPHDQEKLIALTQRLEFKNWLNELLKNQKDPTATDSTVKNNAVVIVHTDAQMQTLLAELERADLFYLNIETTHTDPFKAKLVGITLGFKGTDTTEKELNLGDAKSKKYYYIPLSHLDNETKQLPLEKVLKDLKPFFEDSNRLKLGHNLKYDYHILKNHKISLKGISFDTMLESYVLNSNASKHDRDALSLKYLGFKAISYEDVAGKGVKQLSFDKISILQAANYAAEGAEAILSLHEALFSKLDDSLRNVLNTIEMPLLTVLANMEQAGVLIDQGSLRTHGERLKQRISCLEEEAIALAETPFNLNSPKQLQEILFGKLNLPILYKTPKGQPSTAESALQELAFNYRLPAIILEHRSLNKLVTTYIDALPKSVNPSTSRVHTCYNQAVAATGRLSSSEPNLQNIPIRTEEGRLIRKAFISPPGSFIVAADYSQIELRIMAHLSEDENLVRSFIQGLDIHAATASEIFQVPLDEVSSEQRRRSKAINFGLIYGMSAFGLARQLGIEGKEAQQYMNLYFERYPGVLRYMERTRSQAHEQGYVETLFGRRLYLPEINVPNLARRKAAERMAINAPMQGTAADIIKKAMLAIAEWQSSLEQNDVTMIMQVHDELIFQVHQDKVDLAMDNIKTLMENTVQLSIPLQVSIGKGKNWDEAH